MIPSTRETFAKYADAETFSRIIEFSTLTELWAHCVSSYSDAIALEDDGKQYSFSDLDAAASRFRSALKEAEIPTGSRIGLYAPNSYDFVAMLLGIVTYGCAAVILPPQLDDKTVFGCCMKFTLSAVAYHPSMKEKISFAQGKLSNVKFIDSTSSGAEAIPSAHVSPSDECVIMFTGGTTGKSKGAALSHEAVCQGVINGCYGYVPVFGQRYLLVLPLSHVFGLIRNLLTSLYTGSTLFICRNNQDMFRDIAMFRPTMLVLVPALVEMALMLSKKFGKNMLGDSMRTIICGAAAVAPYLVGEYAKYGINLLPGYGLTESANLVSGNPDSMHKPDSVGIPFPNQEIRIEHGELWLKGKNMMLGYVGEPEETANAYEDGWFKTGDLVRMDEEGFLYITGRIKEIIILSNGENVSPAEVEAHFNELPTVQACQLFEDVLDNGTHILALEVVPRTPELAKLPEESRMKTLMASLEEVNQSLLPYQRAQRITIRDTDFARTPSMKIVRYKKCN